MLINVFGNINHVMISCFIIKECEERYHTKTEPLEGIPSLLGKISRDGGTITSTVLLADIGFDKHPLIGRSRVRFIGKATPTCGRTF